MFAEFVLGLRAAGVPASVTEHLALLGAMRAGVPGYSVEEFYFLSRAVLVKDERHLDRFDRVFAQVFRGVVAPDGSAGAGGPGARELPAEWLRRMAERLLTAEERAQVQALGGFEALMETLRQRLAEQAGRHEGGSKWIGTGGTSPFGNGGYNPEGVRIGGEGRERRAAKVWERREFRDLDDGVALNTRNLKLALRRLRRFARTGAASELDIDGTVRATAHNGGSLDLRMMAERRDTVRVLLFLDVGGSMDDHVRATEELFSAARSEFRTLDAFYFHNCPYEGVWRDNRRRGESAVAVAELMRTYGPGHRVVFVGDATMSPYEIAVPGGSVEGWNEEAGEVWVRRMVGQWPRSAWLNPVPPGAWERTESVRMMRELVEGRMYPLTPGGIVAMTRALGR